MSGDRRIWIRGFGDVIKGRWSDAEMSISWRYGSDDIIELACVRHLKRRVFSLVRDVYGVIGTNYVITSFVSSSCSRVPCSRLSTQVKDVRAPRHLYEVLHDTHLSHFNPLPFTSPTYPSPPLPYFNLLKHEFPPTT